MYVLVLCRVGKVKHYYTGAYESAMGFVAPSSDMAAFFKNEKAAKFAQSFLEDDFAIEKI